MTPCIEWTKKAKADGGYGLIRIKGQLHRVHRLVYENAYGPIPPGMFVLHHCDNPPCYNAEHLFLGGPRENAADMVAKGRHNNLAKTHCMRGHLFEGDNLAFNTDGGRRCRTCHAERCRKAKARRRAAMSNYPNSALAVVNQ